MVNVIFGQYAIDFPETGDAEKHWVNIKQYMGLYLENLKE